MPKTNTRYNNSDSEPIGEMSHELDRAPKVYQFACVYTLASDIFR
jgi:hypothetical protein